MDKMNADPLLAFSLALLAPNPDLSPVLVRPLCVLEPSSDQGPGSILVKGRLGNLLELFDSCLVSFFKSVWQRFAEIKFSA